MMGFGILVPVLLVAAVAYALGWRPQNSGTVANDETAGNNASSALGIAKERYARGEITKAEYEEIRDELRV